jgi:hypothetical protein
MTPRHFTIAQGVALSVVGLALVLGYIGWAFYWFILFGLSTVLLFRLLSLNHQLVLLCEEYSRMVDELRRRLERDTAAPATPRPREESQPMAHQRGGTHEHTRSEWKGPLP